VNSKAFDWLSNSLRESVDVIPDQREHKKGSEDHIKLGEDIRTVELTFQLNDLLLYFRVLVAEDNSEFHSLGLLVLQVRAQTKVA